MAEFNELDLQRIEIVKQLFAAWSSGDADAPSAFMAENGVLWDSIGGQKDGWPAIREYFGHGLDRLLGRKVGTPDLRSRPRG